MKVTTLVLLSTIVLLPRVAQQAAYCGDYPIDARRRLNEYGVKDDVNSLMNALRDDPRQAVRLTAADLLASLGEKRAIPAIRSALASEADETVRAHFGKDLINLQGEDAHALVASLLATSTELDNRIELAWALADIGDLSGYPNVLAGLESESSITKGFAVIVLGVFIEKCKSCDLSPNPIQKALSLLKDPHFSHRSSVVNSLSHGLDHPEVVAALRAVAESDEDEFVRQGAKIVLDSAPLKHGQREEPR